VDVIHYSVVLKLFGAPVLVSAAPGRDDLTVTAKINNTINQSINTIWN
jgi:hypothetical protein